MNGIGRTDFIGDFEWVHSHLDNCDINTPITHCGRPILVGDEPLAVGQFGYPVYPRIYESGLVMLNPRWTEESYSRFYEKYYDQLYRLDLKPDYGAEGVIRHMQEVWNRVISSKLVDPNSYLKILDAGSGPGYGLKWLRDILPNSCLSAVEASPEARVLLKKQLDIDVIDSDLNGSWLTKSFQAFDLIIMRHVVEHILQPVSTLTKIAETLAPSGLIYIAVPDMMNPRTVLRDYVNWWEYWFRAVHPYYYNTKTLFETLALAGLAPVVWGNENEEIWVLARRATSNNIDGIPDITFDHQSELLRRLLQTGCGQTGIG